MPTTPDVANVKLGSCSVTWDGNDLGYTRGGVEVEISTSKKVVSVDQFGETDVNEYIQGRSVMVRVPLAEQDLEKLVNTIPGSTLTVDGTDANVMKLDVNAAVGTSLRDTAAELVLHPFALPATDKSEDFVVPLANAGGDISFAYRYDEERVFQVEFKGYIDHTTGLLFTFGDPAATA